MSWWNSKLKEGMSDRGLPKPKVKGGGKGLRALRLRQSRRRRESRDVLGEADGRVL